MGLRQHMALTPRMQQALRLLQLSSLELTQEIENALVTNPFLEESGENPADEEMGHSAESRGGADTGPVEHTDTSARAETESWSGSDESVFDGARVLARPGNDDGDWAARSGTPLTLHDHLRNQLLLSQMDQRDRALAQFIIEALDEDGFLRVELSELAGLTNREHAVEADELGAILRLIQTLEPPGVGARSLQECLLLQLNRLPDDIPQRSLALLLVGEHLALLAGRQFSKLQELTGCSEQELHGVRVLIRSLNPKPGNQFGPNDTRYVVPDVLVGKSRGRWLATINPAAQPRLQINQVYAGVATDRKSDNGPLFGQLQEARWLIRNVEQRFVTIQRVADAIVDRQRGFFDHGDLSMKPLALKQIAEELSLHESTICRVTNGKYMATPRGLFEFKYFFSRQLETENGPSSATAVRALIREMIDGESSASPLSDALIAQLLKNQGMRVARRTVTKYRNLMKLPSVELRRVIKAAGAAGRQMA